MIPLSEIDKDNLLSKLKHYNVVSQINNLGVEVDVEELKECIKNTKGMSEITFGQVMNKFEIERLALAISQNPKILKLVRK